MSWIEKIFPNKIRTESQKGGSKAVPDGVWDKCPKCGSVLYLPELSANHYVCSHCDHHLRIGARLRLDLFMDQDHRVEIGQNVSPVDMLKFKDTKSYKDRIDVAQKKTQEKDAMVVMSGKLMEQNIVCSAFEFKYMGGSMGSVVGEKFVRGVQAAIDLKCPYVCFTASGGARMQESLFSLMQMGKVSAALARLQQEGLPYIVVLTDPTTGGVSASLAMLGDIHVAEPKALIGFAGPRVIEQTVRETLPPGFQRSEFLQEKGMVDCIVHRRDLRQQVSSLLSKLMHVSEPKLKSQAS